MVIRAQGLSEEAGLVSLRNHLVEATGETEAGLVQGEGSE